MKQLRVFLIGRQPPDSIHVADTQGNCGNACQAFLAREKLRNRRLPKAGVCASLRPAPAVKRQGREFTLNVRSKKICPSIVNSFPTGRKWPLSSARFCLTTHLAYLIALNSMQALRKGRTRGRRKAGGSGARWLDHDGIENTSASPEFGEFVRLQS